MEVRVTDCEIEKNKFCMEPINTRAQLTEKDFGTGVFCFYEGVFSLAGIITDLNWQGHTAVGLRMSHYKKHIDSTVKQLNCLTKEEPHDLFTKIKCVEDNGFSC
ncbi:hypothetical protein Ciccas_007828 [Cichlidogyrus casuarinus]|uniref:Uncharacterized protein n=1 Tax=Cichlidogyrus casuarinus TaxID=1844966 RepID=A0ABD2Q4D4_9PLAT